MTEGAFALYYVKLEMKIAQAAIQEWLEGYLANLFLVSKGYRKKYQDICVDLTKEGVSATRLFPSTTYSK